ncbi:MAG: hypothetical protein ABSB24_19625, partial [Gaiellaceae bacterium]
LAYVAEVVADLHKHARGIHGLRMTFEPEHLRFFQARFEPLEPFSLGGIESTAESATAPI